MGWVLVIGAAWVVLAAVAALLIAGAIRVADRNADAPPAPAAEADQPNFAADRPPVAAAGTTDERHETRVLTSRRREAARVPAPAPAPAPDDSPTID
jgi:hypothetical protein